MRASGIQRFWIVGSFAFLVAFAASSLSFAEATSFQVTSNEVSASEADPPQAAALGAVPNEDWKSIATERFTVHYDANFEAMTPEYVTQVLAALEAARQNLKTLFGVEYTKSLSVFLYREDAYRHEVEDRFGFATIAFYDGAMRLRAPRTAGAELYALLHHEYFHAVFREQTGGDQPFWLNEGLAELFERRVLQRPGLTDAELREIAEALRAERWISLVRLEHNFVSLQAEEIRLAYLESTAAALWVHEHLAPESLAKCLEALALAKQRSASHDAGLRAALGVDSIEIDRALRDAFFANFEAVSP